MEKKSLIDLVRAGFKWLIWLAANCSLSSQDRSSICSLQQTYKYQEKIESNCCAQQQLLHSYSSYGNNSEAYECLLINKDWLQKIFGIS